MRRVKEKDAIIRGLDGLDELSPIAREGVPKGYGGFCCSLMDHDSSE